MSNSATLRKKIIKQLKNHFANARELSKIFHVPEGEINYQLQVVEITVNAGNELFVICPSDCRNCGFDLMGGESVAGLSRCSKCRTEFPWLPNYKIVDKKMINSIGE